MNSDSEDCLFHEIGNHGTNMLFKIIVGQKETKREFVGTMDFLRLALTENLKLLFSPIFNLLSL